MRSISLVVAFLLSITVFGLLQCMLNAASVKQKSVYSPDGIGVMNDGQAASAYLVSRSIPGYIGAMEISLIIRKGISDSGPIVYNKVIGCGHSQDMLIGQMVSEKTIEVFVHVDGQKPDACVLRFSGNKVSVLYKLGSGRPTDVYLRGKKKGVGFDVVEVWDPHYLGLDQDPAYRKGAYAVKVFSWDGTKYKYSHMEVTKSTSGEKW